MKWSSKVIFCNLNFIKDSCPKKGVRQLIRFISCSFFSNSNSNEVHNFFVLNFFECFFKFFSGQSWSSAKLKF